MKRRGRFRRIAMWACTGVAVLMVAVTMGSKWWMVFWRRPVTTGDGVIGSVGEGVAWVARYRPAGPVYNDWNFGRADEWNWGWGQPDVDPRGLGWHYGIVRKPEDVRVSYALGVTLLYPTALSILAAGLLWRADLRARRREKVGSCPACGYDLSGLASGAACPECGAAAAAANVTPR